jgi:hypothetical protein
MNRQPTNGFKKGHKKIEGSGRQPGQPNRLTQDMKEALLAAATRVGFIHEDDILDKDGKPTGRTKKRWNGEGGLEGYLEWAAVYRSSHIISLLGRVMPLQVNVKADVKPKRVPYPSYEAICDDLRAKGIDPDVLERSMEPKFIQEQRKKEELRAALRERGIDPDILEAAPDVIAAIGLKFLEDKKPDPVQ